MKLLILSAFLFSSFTVFAQPKEIQKEKAWLATAKLITQVHEEIKSRDTEESYREFWNSFESKLSEEHKVLFEKSSIRDFEMRSVLLDSFEKSLNEGSTNGIWLLACTMAMLRTGVSCFNGRNFLDNFLVVILIIATLNDSEVSSDI